MKRGFAEKSRQSSGFLRNSKGRYLRKGISPDPDTSFKTKSNQQLFNQITPHLYNPSEQRYSGYSGKFSSSKFAKKSQHSDMYANCEAVGSSESKNYLGQKRKKGKTSYYKKINDVPNLSEAFFTNNKASTTKEVSKVSSPSRSSEQDVAEQGAQETHYRMVEFQQKCKRVVNN